MRKDTRRHQLAEVMGLLEEQMADISAFQKKQAELRANASAADGMVEVTVNAQGHLVKTVIDESYLDDHEFDELCDHITEAAEAAVRDATRQVSELLGPINDHRKGFPSLSDIVDGTPDLRDLVPPGLLPAVAPQSLQDSDEDTGDENRFPTIRR